MNGDVGRGLDPGRYGRLAGVSLSTPFAAARRGFPPGPPGGRREGASSGHGPGPGGRLWLRERGFLARALVVELGVRAILVVRLGGAIERIVVGRPPWERAVRAVVRLGHRAASLHP